MANVVPQKIVLKSTTKLTLNERFSYYKPTTPQRSTTTAAAAAAQATVKNRRLAQQMANRPTVQAALKAKRKSLSLKQRLGANSVKSRLDLPASATFRGRGGSWRARGGSVPATQNFRGSGRGSRSWESSLYRRGRGVRGVRGGGVRGTRGGGMRGSRGGGVRGGGVRGTRGGRARGRRGSGRGSRGSTRGTNMTREQLDVQLDAYMTGPKSQTEHDMES